VETIASDLLSLKSKQGILMTEGEQEPYMAWELYESEGKSWLSDGWSFDVITTDKRGGIGIAKDIYESETLNVDLGAYVTQEYEGLFQGNIEPKFGMGLSVGF
jgi:hypothetical protein